MSKISLNLSALKSRFCVSCMKFVAFFELILLLDQFIKQIFLNGYRFDGDFISLILTFNDGVAFSMFAFLGKWLKYIQILLLCALTIYFFYQRDFFIKFSPILGALIGAGSSNLLDRFIYGGVVDYIFWHKWFEFAVFNFADIIINICVIMILLLEIFQKSVRSKNGIFH